MHGHVWETEVHWPHLGASGWVRGQEKLKDHFWYSVTNRRAGVLFPERTATRKEYVSVVLKLLWFIQGVILRVTG